MSVESMRNANNENDYKFIKNVNLKKLICFVPQWSFFLLHSPFGAARRSPR
jgi:hypothetical protein